MRNLTLMKIARRFRWVFVPLTAPHNALASTGF
jgi:hypothetical protein